MDFIQRAAGYSLLGSTREKVFFILYGRGRNGKGRFLRVLLALFGELGLNTVFSTLIADRSGNKGPRDDIAAMAGRRFVSAQESREGAQFPTKSLTSTRLPAEISITARFLHIHLPPNVEDLDEATNHRPEIRGSDTGIWSRPKLIPTTCRQRPLRDDLIFPTLKPARCVSSRKLSRITKPNRRSSGHSGSDLLGRRAGHSRRTSSGTAHRKTPKRSCGIRSLNMMSWYMKQIPETGVRGRREDGRRSLQRRTSPASRARSPSNDRFVGVLWG